MVLTMTIIASYETGDFASLMQHMYANARNRGEELLLFDSGDQIEGTGISDATAIHGQFIFPIMSKIQNYTALTMGKHRYLCRMHR